MHDFLDSVRKRFSLEKVSLSRTVEWAITDGVLQHSTGGFFSVIGIKEGETEQVMLYQPQSAVTGLLWFQSEKAERWLLLQARAEPGNCGVAQFGPSIQSTQANSFKLHGGQAAPYVKHFLQYQQSIKKINHDSEQVDLGGRYFFKTKRLAIIQVDNKFGPAPGFIWIKESNILANINQGFFFNTDLRSLLTIFGLSLSKTSNNEISLLGNQVVRHSLEAPIRKYMLGEVCQRLSDDSGHSHILPLSELKDWRLSEDGIFENGTHQRYCVEFFHVELEGREVRSWYQPLIKSLNKGAIVLYCRFNEGLMEVGVRASAEIGLKPKTCLQPSYLRYPGDPQLDPLHPGILLCEVLESDEGGRFYENVSSYQIRLIDDSETEIDELIWLRMSEIGWFITRSNFCSIQLRVVLSHIFGCSFGRV